MFISFSIRWVKRYQIGQSSAGRRVNLLEFVQRQRKRTKAKLAVMNFKAHSRRPRLQGNPFLSMGLGKEKWRRGRRTGGRAPKYMGRPANFAISPLRKFQQRPSAPRRPDNHLLDLKATPQPTQADKISAVPGVTEDVQRTTIEKASTGKL